MFCGTGLKPVLSKVKVTKKISTDQTWNGFLGIQVWRYSVTLRICIEFIIFIYIYLSPIYRIYVESKSILIYGCVRQPSSAIEIPHQPRWGRHRAPRNGMFNRMGARAVRLLRVRRLQDNLSWWKSDVTILGKYEAKAGDTIPSMG